MKIGLVFGILVLSTSVLAANSLITRQGKDLVTATCTADGGLLTFEFENNKEVCIFTDKVVKSLGDTLAVISFLKAHPQTVFLCEGKKVEGLGVYADKVSLVLEQ